jgi:hypothetical protein
VSPHREAPAAVTDREEFLRSRTRHDLAARLRRTEQDVQVLEVRRVYWQSEALGCPEPGQRAAPGITPGYLVRLGVGGIEYRYHAGADGEPFVCPPARAEPWLDSSVD